jgi:hypothetical protein
MKIITKREALKFVTAALEVTIRGNISLLDCEKSFGERKVGKLAGRWENEI